MQHKGAVLWFTGLSGAGKSTVSERLYAILNELGCPHVELLDGDVVRTNLSKGLGFSKEDRDTNIRRIGFVGELLARHGVIVMTAAISPYREVREELKERIPNFIEIFVDAPLEECIRRDVKGLYQKALSGEIPQFTGVSDPYEPPLDPALTLHTRDESVEESANQVLQYLFDNGYLSRANA
ncbi:adenylyl-sulfate kinase [Leptolyngbya sp. FACHB-261]|nr:adenylyl-sulfate kinase [Leptolyngbya sp. FACHB-261]